MDLLEEYAHDILYGIGGYQDFQFYEMAIPKNDTQVALVIWTLKCLANVRNPKSEEVLNAILERRKFMQE